MSRDFFSPVNLLRPSRLGNAGNQVPSRQHFQISTDGFQPYRSAITTTLSDRCDFAQLIKVYTQDPEGQRRYSPPDVTHAEKVPSWVTPIPRRFARPMSSART